MKLTGWHLPGNQGVVRGTGSGDTMIPQIIEDDVPGTKANSTAQPSGLSDIDLSRKAGRLYED
jgi:hypothetical protein